MCEKWSDADMARFLDAYQNYDVLWNPQNELYRNLQARRAALQAILQHINKPTMSENDLKNKIKNIRTTYNRELAKVLKSLKSGSGTDDIYVPVLVWFKHADSFLRTVSTGGRKSQSNMNYQNLSQLTEDSEDTSQQMQHVTETNFQLDINDPNGEEESSQDRPHRPHLSLNITPKETHQHQPSMSATRPTTELAIATPKNRSLIGKQEKRKICQVSSSSALNTALSKLEKISRGPQAEDEFTTFGKHIANQLRQLPLRRALEIQQKFQDTLTQERIQYLNSMAQPNYNSESTPERVASRNNTPDDYYSSDTQFSSIWSPPSQNPSVTLEMTSTSMNNTPGDLLAAAFATINEN